MMISDRLHNEIRSPEPDPLRLQQVVFCDFFHAVDDRYTQIIYLQFFTFSDGKSAHCPPLLLMFCIPGQWHMYSRLCESVDR